MDIFDEYNQEFWDKYGDDEDVGDAYQYLYCPSKDRFTFARKVIEKQIPKTVHAYDKQAEEWLCPNCFTEYVYRYTKTTGDKYCSNCGQRLDWD